MQTISFQITKEMDRAIAELASREQLSKSDILRRFARAGLERSEVKTPIKRRKASKPAPVTAA